MSNNIVNPYDAPEAIDQLEINIDTGSYGGYGRLQFFLLSIASGLLVFIPILGILLNLGLVIFISRRRFQNIGKNPNLGWLAIIPFVNIWTSFNCIVYPSGYAQHKTLDKAAKVIITLYVGCKPIYGVPFIIITHSSRESFSSFL